LKENKEQEQEEAENGAVSGKFFFAANLFFEVAD